MYYYIWVSIFLNILAHSLSVKTLSDARYNSFFFHFEFARFFFFFFAKDLVYSKQAKDLSYSIWIHSILFVCIFFLPLLRTSFYVRTFVILFFFLLSSITLFHFSTLYPNNIFCRLWHIVASFEISCCSCRYLSYKWLNTFPKCIVHFLLTRQYYRVFLYKLGSMVCNKLNVKCTSPQLCNSR